MEGKNKKDNLNVAFPSPVTVRLRSRFRPQALNTPELTCFEMRINAGGSQRSIESCASARRFLALLAYLDRLPAPARWEQNP